MNLQRFSEPFPHWVGDRIFPDSLIEAALAEWPGEQWAHWHKYDSEHAWKYATRDPMRMPAACRLLFERLCCLDVSRLTGIEGTFPDFNGYGAGMHWIPDGGFLGVHRDAATHPTAGWSRRLSVCLYLNRVEGGNLELYRAADGPPIRYVAPERNRLVIFETTDSAFHGVPTPVSSPTGRKSIAAFFWSRSGVASERTSAEFV